MAIKTAKEYVLERLKAPASAEWPRGSANYSCEDLGEGRFASPTTGNGRPGRIAIFVSHRFSTVRMADLIVVLDSARVAQVSSHRNVMAPAAPTPTAIASRQPRIAER